MFIMERMLLTSQVTFMRGIFTSATLNKNYVARQGKMLTKIMHGTANKKKFKMNANLPSIMPVPSNLSKNTSGQPGTSKRRIFVLNKLFMRYITDIMAMGAISNDVVGQGIEISRVKINTDYNKVNVYWLAKGTENDAKIENILKTSAAQLRHELSQLRVMGQVPRIEFVKDKYYALVAEVDACLAKADFGEDYIPTDNSQHLRSEFSLNMQLTEVLKNKLSELDGSEENEEIPENPLPAMSSDIFGLNHSKIMNKVLQAVQQSNQAWEKSKSNIVFTNESCTSNSLDKIRTEVENLSYRERKEQFTEFLLKRQILKSKAMKKEKYNSLADKEYILSELQNSNKSDEDEYEEDIDDEDFEELR